LRDLVIALDVSPSMGRPAERVRPSKLSAARDALAYAVARLLEREPTARVGLVVFYRHAYPALPLTSDPHLFARTLALARVLGPGTAPGDALIESVKLLRRSGRGRRVLIITDGGFNEGVRLDYAAYYARNSSIPVDIVTVGDGVPDRGKELVEATAKMTGGRWVHASTREELYSTIALLLGVLGGQHQPH